MPVGPNYRRGINVGSPFKIGGTQVTASAAELNLIDNSVAGTSVASKALVLGANKNTDVLALPVSGLRIGAAAGTAVSASAAEINKLTGLGSTAAELDAAADVSTFGAAGHHPLMVAVFDFDTAVVGNRTVAAHGTGVTIPIHGIVVGGFVDVNTVFTSANGNNGTIAISVEGANDIISATAVSGAPYSSIARKPIVPKANTPDSTSVKATAAREITCTVAVSALTAGKLTGYLYWIQGVASA